MKIGILGFGVVGSGTAEVFYKNRASIERKAGRTLDVKYILDLRDLSGTEWADKQAKSFEQILDDPEVGVVVETIGGLKPAYDFTRRALMAKKHVVTSNKELVATHGAELLALAKAQDVNYLFEASVGGGIPIIHPLYQCLGAGEIVEIAGILNGTTNFIMTRMIQDGMSFAEALALAQKNGYAEADPSADVEGKDACRKICILAAIAFGRHVYPDEVSTEGITAITPEDVAAASAAGCVVKLIGRARRMEGDRLMVMVSPALIDKSSQLANVSDVYNGILVRGADTGDVVFYGRGAGKLPTASAVLSDVVDAVKAGSHIDTLGWVDAGRGIVGDHLLDETPWLIRQSGPDVSALFGDCKPLGAMADGSRAFLTPVLSGAKVQELSAQAAQKGVVIATVLRRLDY